MEQLWRGICAAGGVELAPGRVRPVGRVHAGGRRQAALLVQNASNHELGDVEWDSANTRFTYTIVEKQFSQTLSEMIENKINNLKSNLNNKLAETDWVFIRQLDKGTSIPSDTQSERDALRTSAQAKEVEIGALTTKSAVADYDITL